MPIVSSKIWEDKDKFVQAVYTINKYLHDKKHYTMYLGYAKSRLHPDVMVGTGEYNDNTNIRRSII